MVIIIERGAKKYYEKVFKGTQKYIFGFACVHHLIRIRHFCIPQDHAKAGGLILGKHPGTDG